MRYHYWHVYKVSDRYFVYNNKFIKIMNPLVEKVTMMIDDKVKIDGRVGYRRVSVLEDEGKVAIAILNPKDQFSKKIVRKILKGRIMHG